MGQFKPMVKMMTTEPTVELKLKKGGTVKGHKNMKSGGCMKKGGKAEGHGHKPMHMMDGGISAALAGEPMIAPKRRRIAPMPMVGKPSLAARRAAMAGAKAGARAGARQGALASMMGGMKTGGVAKGQGGYKTGGVAKGQGGYKSGGIIRSTTGVTKVNSATADHSPAKTGDVKLGKAGGYKKGGSTKKMAGGGWCGTDMVNRRLMDSKATITGGGKTFTNVPAKLAGLGPDGKGIKSQVVSTKNAQPTPPPPKAVMKKGGSAKKFAEGGSVQDGGRPQKMAQGAKKPSSAVSIDKLSGTFKKGGKVASKKLQAVFKKENAPAMKAAKADSNLKYSKYQKMQKFADGGTVDATGTLLDGFSPDSLLVMDIASGEKDFVANNLNKLKSSPAFAQTAKGPIGGTPGDLTSSDYMAYLSSIMPAMTTQTPPRPSGGGFPSPSRVTPGGIMPNKGADRLKFNPPPRPGNIGASGGIGGVLPMKGGVFGGAMNPENTTFTKNYGTSLGGGMPLLGQNPQVADLIRQGNMQGAMGLQNKLALQNGKDIVQRPYKKGGKVKGYAGGGMSDYEQYMSPEEQLKEMRMRKAMDRGYGQVSERETASNEALLDSISSLPKAVKDMVRKAMRSSGAVTDTEKTVSRTVVPAKKRGGKIRK